MRSLLSNFSLILFSLLAIVGITLVLVFFDLTGVHPEPLLIKRTPFDLPDLDQLAALLNNPAPVLRDNPLAWRDLPALLTTPTRVPEISSPFPPSSGGAQRQATAPAFVSTPDPTLTPVIPLEPAEYQTQVILRARNFATALEAFQSANDRIGQDETLLHDPVWRSEIYATLTQVEESGRALSSVGPPPPEYLAIHNWLARVGPEAQGLRKNYELSLDSGDTAGFVAAGDNILHIKEYFLAALVEMSESGWPLE